MNDPKFGVYNLTLDRWVRDGDSDDLCVFETTDLVHASFALDRVIEISSMNPSRNYEFMLRLRP